MIWHSPKVNPSNPYNQILCESIEQESKSVANFRIRNIFNLRKGDLIHFHWVHNYYQNKDGNVNQLKFIIVKLVLFYWKIRGVKVGWTVHNLLPHIHHDRQKEIKVRSELMKKMNFLVLHSEEIKMDLIKMYGNHCINKINIIPHPHYREYYQKLIKDELIINENDSSEFTLLFFGTIKRYKGIIELIKTFKMVEGRNMNLRILGKCDDVELENEIKNAIRNEDNIYFENNFVKDEILIPEIFSCDVVILPYQEITTSGSVILSASLQKQLLAKDAPFIRSIYGDSAVYFNSYDHLVEILNEWDLKDVLSGNTVSIDNMDPKCVGKLHVDMYRKVLLGK